MYCCGFRALLFNFGSLSIFDYSIVNVKKIFIFYYTSMYNLCILHSSGFLFNIL